MADKKIWLIVGGLAIAGGLIYYFVTKEKEPQPPIPPPPGEVSAQINSFTISA